MTNFRPDFLCIVALLLALLRRPRRRSQQAAHRRRPNSRTARPGAEAAAPAAAAANPRRQRYAARAIRRLGRLHGQPRRQESLLRARQADARRPIRPSRPRDPAFLFVSTRPAEKVKEEVSVDHRLSVQARSEATVEVGATNFALYTQNDGAWIKNAAEEARMVDAMRKGADLVVKGNPARGTKIHRHLLAQGYRAGARPRRAGVQVAVSGAALALMPASPIYAKPRRKPRPL